MLAAASLALNQAGEGSSPSGPTPLNIGWKTKDHIDRRVGKLGNPPALGAGDRRFKSDHADLKNRTVEPNIFLGV